MDTIQADVLVVGAGPAGSIAARRAARNGAKVILIEQKTSVGIPVQCGEYVPGSIGEFSGSYAESIVQEIKGIKTYINCRPAVYTRAPGYIIQRQIFDGNLAREAQEQGVNLVTGARLEGRDDSGVIVKLAKETVKVFPRIIIGADGPRSLAAGWINDSGPLLAAAAQHTVKLRKPLEDAEVFLDEAYPGGYAWLFPKGKAGNLGVAVDPKLGGDVGKALRQFTKFISKTGILSSAEPVDTISGFIPISGPLPNVQKNNILLVGDAGGFTHPITGGGILHALITGQLAGKISALALSEDDLEILKNYGSAWAAVLGETMIRGTRKRRYLETVRPNRLGDDFAAVARKTWIAFPEYYQGEAK